MYDRMEERCKNVADYVIATKATVRKAAKKFGISKSTAHKDLVERLEKIDSVKAKVVAEILQFNKAERHIRGGAATRAKYQKLKEH